jgi:hypothetical protein
MAGERKIRADIFKNAAGLLFDLPSTEGKLALDNQYRFVESLAASSNTSTTVYNTKATLDTVTALPLGSYAIVADFKWWLAAGNRAMSIQILDGVTVLKTIELTSSVGANDRPTKTIIHRIPNISGIKSFNLRFKAGTTLITNATTANISEVTLHLWRVL